MTQNNFDRILISPVNKSLCLLGDSSKQTILSHLECSFQIKEENIPSNFAEFKNALESIFGPSALYLEEAIVKSYLEKLGLRFENKSRNFLECVEIAKGMTVNIGEKNVKRKAKSATCSEA